MSKQNNSKWHYVDLHVHSPASKDYNGTNSADEYKKLILKAVNKSSKNALDAEESIQIITGEKLSLIAITDHNSVEGFKEIMKLKRESVEILQKLRERYSKTDILSEFEEDEKIFSSIHVLMGVEVSPNPGIHLLIIFQENVAPEEAEQFLDDGLDGKYEKLKGSPDPLLKWNIEQLMDEVESRFGEKAIIVAPHADSSKGIYESLKSLPQARISAFKHSKLKAISFNNPDNRERMKQLLKSSDYTRESGLAFIQSSDYHGHTTNEIGSTFTKIQFPTGKVNYSTLVTSLQVEENIVCFIDIINDVYSSITSGWTVTKFQINGNNGEISECDYHMLSDTVCSYLNSDGGVIELQVTNITDDAKSNLLKTIKEHLLYVINTKVKPSIKDIIIRTLPTSNTKLLILTYFMRSSRLHTSDGRIFVNNSNNVNEATASQIEYIVAQNISRRFGGDWAASLGTVSHEAKRLANANDAYPIAIKVDEHIEYLNYKTTTIIKNEISPSNEYIANLIKNNPNGDAKGNLLIVPNVVQAPRHKDAYLRFSSILLDADITQVDICSDNNIDGILVMRGGGTNLIQANKKIYYSSSSTTMQFKDNSDIYSYFAWIKSSYFTWYCLFILGSEDLYKSLLLKENVPMPTKKLLEEIENASHLITKSINHEYTFLKILNTINVEEENDKYNKLVNEFNFEMNAYCLELDEVIFDALSLSADERTSIYRSLNELGIYTFDLELKNDLDD